MSYPHEDIIDAIRKERKRQGLSQYDLAKLLGVPQPSIARIETRGISPTLGMLTRICDALGMDVIAAKKQQINRRLVLCLDMAGCPNRCRHCWLGDSLSNRLADEDAGWVVSLFKPYFRDITFYSWFREPDFLPDYRQRWERDCALSSIRPKRFELASFYRLARDPNYVLFLKEVGVQKVQLTFFGMEGTTDRYVGREGAFRELLTANDILKGNGIETRWQIFINEENKGEIEATIKLAQEKGVKEIFVHEGSCDGNNRKLYGIRIQKGNIPDAVKPYYLDYDRVTTEAELCKRFETDGGHFLPHNEGDVVLYVTSDFNVYFHFTNLSPAWRVGNLRVDPIDAIAKRVDSEQVPALFLAKSVTIGMLVRRYGDPASERVFSEEDFKMYLLNEYLDEKYNNGKNLEQVYEKIEKLMNRY